MNLIKFSLVSGDTSFKKICKFFNDPALISCRLSFKYFSIIGTKSSSVISGPKILANSWIECERVLLILVSLNLATFKYNFLKISHFSLPRT